MTYDEIAERARALPEPLFLGGSRLVIHIQTSEQAADDFLEIVRKLAKEKRDAGFVPTNPSADSDIKDIYVRRAPK